MKDFIPPLSGVALLLVVVLSGCTRPDFRVMNEPVMTTYQMQAELERLHRINQTIGDEDFNPGSFPISVGIDSRNGKILIEKFICWDECPIMGMVFLVYQDVASAQACVDAVVGTPLISPDPIPGEYWGCRPVVDWLNRTGEVPS